MTMYFDDVLAGVAARLAHDREQYFIDRLRIFGIVNLPVVEGMRTERPVTSMPTAKNFSRDFLRIGSANPNNGDATLAWRRGDRGYGVFLVHGAG